MDRRILHNSLKFLELILQFSLKAFFYQRLTDNVRQVWQYVLGEMGAKCTFNAAAEVFSNHFLPKEGDLAPDYQDFADLKCDASPKLIWVKMLKLASSMGGRWKQEDLI